MERRRTGDISVAQAIFFLVIIFLDSMLPSSSGVTRQTIPIICKLLMTINVVLFILELLFSSLVSSYCLSPRRILYYPAEYASSLFLSNYFHLNPMQSGPMGVFHILMNMMTLANVGSFLEKELGSIVFFGMTLYFSLCVGPLQVPIAMLLNFLSMNKISLFSLYQCGIGFSGILFAYFIVYVKLIPNEEVSIFGMRCRKWISPLLQLVLLSLFLSASFIGHLSGILMGYLYITGLPGCFQRRHDLIKKLENMAMLKFLTNRHDFYACSQQPKITHLNFTPCASGVSSSSSPVPYALLARNSSNTGNGNNNGRSSSVEMTCVDGVLVPKSSVQSNV